MMTHIVSRQPWATVDIDTVAGRVFFSANMAIYLDFVYTDSSGMDTGRTAEFS